MKHDLTVIIVSFNTKEVLAKCLQILTAEIKNSQGNTEVIIVDNHSTDGTQRMVKSNFPAYSLIINNKNIGFSAANNQAIDRARGEYILLLNSDAFLTMGALKNLFSFISHHKEVAVAGGKLYNRNQTVQQSAGFAPTPLRIFSWMFFLDRLPLSSFFVNPYHIKNSNFYEKQQEVDWVTGALFLAKKSILSSVGGFDPKMFMYVEEVDLCYRIKKSGGHIIYTPQFSAVHLKGESSSSGTAGLIEEFKGIKYFYQKHFPNFPHALLNLILKLGALFRLIFFAIMGMGRKKEIYGKIFKVV